jgi:hypothetical protein
MAHQGVRFGLSKIENLTFADVEEIARVMTTKSVLEIAKATCPLLKKFSIVDGHTQWYYRNVGQEQNLQLVTVDHCLKEVYLFDMFNYPDGPLVPVSPPRILNVASRRIRNVEQRYGDIKQEAMLDVEAWGGIEFSVSLFTWMREQEEIATEEV